MKKYRINKLLKTILKLIVIAIAFKMLASFGINPFWSILIMLWWKAMIRIGLLLAGLMWVTGFIM